MGGSQSTEKKGVETHGAVNNNLTLATTETKLFDIEVILLVLCGMRVIEMIIYIYVSHLRRMKRRYTQRPTNNNNGDNIEL